MTTAQQWWRLALAALALNGLAACGTSNGVDEGPDPPVEGPVQINNLHVSPGDTGDGIANVLGEDRAHYVLQPEAAGRHNVLVIFLGGTGSTPSDYSAIADHVSNLGFAVVDLRYPDGRLVGAFCNASDACFTNLRGETCFGAATAYASGSPTYDSKIIGVDAANSIIGRTVAVIDYMATLGGDRDPDYWRQFLIADPQSPYMSRHFGPAYPDWSKIIIAGHSQGGGDAAFIGLHLPAGSALRRVVMLSAPNDNVDELISASWISQPSATPLSRFWGLRAANEGLYGSFISKNWRLLGGAGSGGVGGDDEDEVDVGDGSGDPQGSHRLVLDSRGAPLRQHDSTATNDPGDYFPAWRSLAWDYLFTGGASSN